ncbi:MAG: MATE family efflux transporter [Blautia sp.]
MKHIHTTKENDHDFSQGSIPGNILRLSLPLMAAQFINVLYNIVDRMYIGRIPGADTAALTGMGVCFPVITVIMAFAFLVGTGGPPLCSIARGRQENEKAEHIMGNSFILLTGTGIVLILLGLLVKKPLLYALGASDVTFPYADQYISIYLLGSVFVMIAVGMNGFINCQGFAGIGMLTVVIGAVINIILDPVFIFLLHMGVQGAAAATVISQAVSAGWILRFLTGKQTHLRLRTSNWKLELSYVREILSLGLSGFIMQATNCIVQIVCNVTLHNFGGDIYVGVMTIIHSVREVLSVPVNGLTQGAQPVIGFNYGAKKYTRVKQGIKFMSVICIGYTILVWIVTMMIPGAFIALFNGSKDLMEVGVHAMRIYFFGFCFMSLQFSGQTVFTGLGKAKQAIFFSLFRKVVIVVPLTLLLPHVAGLGVDGVFLAEPVSNFIGGTACFVTMFCIMWPALSDEKSK